MVKINSLFLKEIWGSIKNNTFKTYGDKRKLVLTKSIPAPTYTRTTAQDQQRNKFASAVASWNALSEAEKQQYNEQASPYGLTGYQYFIQQQLLQQAPPSWRPVITDGLISYYSFEVIEGTTCKDEVDSNDGTINGNPTQETDPWGNENGMFYYDGSDDYIEIPKSDNLYPQNEVTYLAFFKITGEPNDYPHVFGTGDDGKYRQIFWNSSYNKIYGRLRIAGTAQTIDTSELNLNQWYMVTLLYDGSKMQLWINKDLAAELTGLSGTLDIPSTPMRIGSNPYLSPREWQGYIDEFHIYNRALTDTEIAQIYDTYIDHMA